MNKKRFPKIVTYRSKMNGRWYVRLIPANGKGVKWRATGGKDNGYKRKQTAERVANQAKQDFANAQIVK